jgi:hypothetical protein
MSDSNKNLVMGLKWGPDTKLNWPTDHRSQYDLNLKPVQSTYEAEVNVSLQWSGATRSWWPEVAVKRSYETASKDVNMETEESTVLRSVTKKRMLKT